MKYLFLLFSFVFAYSLLKAQCNNLNPYGSVSAPNTGTIVISGCSYQTEYSTIDSVQAATIYQCEISDNSYITIRQGSPGGLVIASGYSPLTWISTSAGTYYAHWNTDSNCGIASICLNTTITYVSAAFPCSGIPAPGNTVSSLGNIVCSNLNFNLNLQNNLLASGITYQWYSSNDGLTYDSIVGANNSSYSSSISSPTYFYCSEECAGNLTNSSPLNITIAPFNQCYCTPSYFNGTSAGDLISNIEIIGTTLSNNTGFVTGIPSYNFFTGQPNYTATLLPSASYSLAISTGEFGSQGYAAWIDYNDDGVFSTNERIGYTIGTIGFGYTIGQVNDSSTFVISLSCSPPAGSHRLRIRGAYYIDGNQIDPCIFYSYGETEDYEITIANPPSCPSAGLVISALTTQSSSLVSWSLSCSSSSVFDFEYGPVGFIPGTGSFLNNQTVTLNGGTASYTFVGLTPNTEYTFYYRSNCGAEYSLWSAANEFITLCSSISALGWCEGFDFDSQTKACWKVLNVNNDFSSWNINTQFNQLNGDNCVSITTDFNAGANDDWLITPQLTLSGSEILSFYYKVNNGFEPNDLKIKISTTGINPADFTQTLLSMDTISNTEYQDTSVNLDSFSGNVYIAFHIPQGGLDGWVLYLDQICIQECVPASIQDDSIEICQTADSLDLTTVLNIGQSYGSWSFVQEPTNLNGSVLQLNGLTTGVYEANYLVNNACQSTSSTAFINLYEASNAGIDSLVVLCKAEPFDLFNALGGSFQTIGTWYDPANQALPSSFIVTGNIPGQFNYDYIMTNGVCTSDSSNALVIVNNCIYVDLEENTKLNISIFPNPTNDLLTVQATATSGQSKLLIQDLNGRIVYQEVVSFNQTTKHIINVEKLSAGLYNLILINQDDTKVIKFSKN